MVRTCRRCDEAVLAGDFVAFGEFGDGLDLPLHFLQLAGQGTDTHDGLQQVAEVFGVDVDRVVGQHAALFQAAQAFADAGRGQAGDAGQGLEGQPGVVHQSADQLLVDGVDHGVRLINKGH